GKPRLFVDGIFPTPNGRARFHAVRHQPPAEDPTPYYPLYLTTGRLTGHYNSGTQTRRVTELTQLNAEPRVEMHPATARRYGIVAADKVWLQTRGGGGRSPHRVTRSNVAADT